MRTIPISTTPAVATPPESRVGAQLEQAFLEEMLKYAGPKPSDDSFGGGIGEQQFSTFLTREYAAILNESLDLGFDARIGGGS